MTWAIIWTNLVYKSTIVKWYMLNEPAGENYGKNDLIYMLGKRLFKVHARQRRNRAAWDIQQKSHRVKSQESIPIWQGNSYKYRQQSWN